MMLITIAIGGRLVIHRLYNDTKMDILVYDLPFYEYYHDCCG